ncbi:hypothetical protein V2J09_009971 [Rumex salicifolius]
MAGGDTILDLGRRVEGGAAEQNGGRRRPQRAGDRWGYRDGDDVFRPEEGDVEVLRGIFPDGERPTTSTRRWSKFSRRLTILEVDQGDLQCRSEELGAVLEGGNTEDVDDVFLSIRELTQTGRHPKFQPITVSAHKRRVLGVGGSSSGEDILEHNDAGTESAPPPSEQPPIDDALPSV